MQTEFLIISSSCPDLDTAKNIARSLVNTKLAACVHIAQAITSVYVWQGEVCEEQEIPLQIKCLACNYQAIQELIIKLHPYDVPELIATPLTQGLPAYFDWIKDSTQA